MSLKTTTQNFIRSVHRFSQGSSHHRSSSSSSSQKRAYRTEYQRYMWGAAFVIIYFSFIVFSINSDTEGSSNNNGIIILVLGSLVFAGIGAYLAPGLTGIASRYTAHGRRKAAARALPRSRSSVSGSRTRSHTGSQTGSHTTAGSNLPTQDPSNHSSVPTDTVVESPHKDAQR